MTPTETFTRAKKGETSLWVFDQQAIAREDCGLQSQASEHCLYLLFHLPTVV